MNAIGCYLLFVISLAGMILSDDPFSEQNKNEFYNHLFEMHNMTRNIHEVPLLRRNTSMDNEANQILMDYILQKKKYSSKKYGIVYFTKAYNNNTKLDMAYAKSLFSIFYTWRIFSNNNAEKFNEARDLTEYIVWNGTEEIGMAVGRSNDVYGVVVLYSPRNNTTKEFSSVDQAGPSQG